MNMETAQQAEAAVPHGHKHRAALSERAYTPTGLHDKCRCGMVREAIRNFGYLRGYQYLEWHSEGTDE